MKRIAIVSLLSVFLTTNYAYAAFPVEKLYQKIEKAQTQELTREDIDELYNDVIASMDSEDSGNQSIEIKGLESCFRSIVFYLLINAVIGNIFGQFTYIVQVLLFLDVLSACLF